MIQPIAQKDSSSTVIRPRCLVGENSETNVEATGSSAPRPRPMTSRAISRAASDHDNAIPPLARPKITSVAEKTVLRANAVGHEAAKRGADRHSDETDGQHPAFLGRRQIEMRIGRDGGHDERHQTNVHRVERPSNTRSHQQLPVRLVERQSVKTLVASQRDLSPTVCCDADINTPLSLFSYCVVSSFKPDDGRRSRRHQCG